MKDLLLGFLLVLVIAYCVGSYLDNIWKLTKCDFAAPYKCEVIHVMGIVAPPVSLVTVWADVDR